MEQAEHRRIVVLLRKTKEEYGIHLMELEKSILVYFIVPDSPASKEGLLYVGDRVLAIGESKQMRNRKSVEGLHPADVMTLINSHLNEVSLRVIFHERAYQILHQQFGTPLKDSYDRRSVFSLPGHLSPPTLTEQSSGATKAIRGFRKTLGRAVRAFGKKLSGFDTPASDRSTSTISHSKTFPMMHTDTSERNTNGQKHRDGAASRGNRGSAMTAVSEMEEEYSYNRPLCNEGVYDGIYEEDPYFQIALQSDLEVQVPLNELRGFVPPPPPNVNPTDEIAPLPANFASAKIQPATLSPPSTSLSLPLQNRMPSTMPVPRSQLNHSPREHDVSTQLGAFALEGMTVSGSPSGGGDSHRRGLDEPDRPASPAIRTLKYSRSTCTSKEGNKPATTGYLVPLNAHESALSISPIAGNESGRVIQGSPSRTSSRLSKPVDYSLAGERPTSQVAAESTVQGADTHSSDMLSSASGPPPTYPLRQTGGSATSSTETSGPSASVATGAVANGADAGAGAGEGNYSNSASSKNTLYECGGFRFQSRDPSSPIYMIYGTSGAGDVCMRPAQRHADEVGPLTMASPPSPPVSLNPESLCMDDEEHIYDD